MINKNKIIFPSDDEETKLFVSKTCDLYRRSEITGKSFFTKFLTPLESKIIKERFSHGDVKISFFGGYEESERNIARFYTDEYDDLYGENYPLCALVIKSKNKEALSHRDYLGCVLGLGIKRELIGDIVVREEDAVLFCMNEISGFIKDSLFKVGNSGVIVEIENDAENIKIKRNFELLSLTVSSMRADCVVSAICNLSRSKASEFVERKLVNLNYEILSSNSRIISEGDVISVRGKGKFRISSEDGFTKKGRIHITAEKYL